ncbi:MAG: cell envelope biogenesis protein TolA [Flavobacterium sp.]|nr:MAG: cell envelope biogenesis protein TolA [Flavobacterium sp.]
MGSQFAELTAETALTVFTVENGLDPYVQQVKDEVNSFEHDLSTKAGRGRSASLAAKVAKMKVKLDNLGKDLVAEWKSNSKKVDGTRKKMRDDLDELKVIARKPLSDWEDEQQKIEDEKQAKLEAEMKAAQVESDHEIGLLMNEKIDRDLADEKIRVEAQEKAEAERIDRERLEREDLLKQEAAATAKAEAERIARETEQRIENEKQEAIQREEAAKQAQANAEREAIVAQEREKYAAEQAEAQRKQDAINAEQNRLEAIEQAKQTQIKAQKDRQDAEIAEAKRREADKKYMAGVHNAILKVLTDNGISKEDGKTMIKLAATARLPQLTINY